MQVVGLSHLNERQPGEQGTKDQTRLNILHTSTQNPSRTWYCRCFEVKYTKKCLRLCGHDKTGDKHVDMKAYEKVYSAEVYFREFKIENFCFFNI